MLENMNSKIEGLSSSIKNQLSFNKMIEIQIGQIATALPISDLENILWKPETSFKSIKMVLVRFGKPLYRESQGYFIYLHHQEGRSWSPGNHMLDWPTCLPQCLLRPWSK
jgi:hypothetical protein